MHIMLMAQCYAPEDVSAAVLITDLATDLVNMGHRVTMITGAPSYPHGRVFDGYHNGLYSTELLDGVHVVRTWSYISPTQKTLPRLLHYGTYSLTAFYGGLFSAKPDVLVSFSPPLPLGLSAWILSRLWHIPWVLQIEDLYPDAAITAGLLTNKKIIQFFLWLENFLYQKAHRISLITENFRRTLLRKGVPDSKLVVIPVWADPKEVQPLARENAFRHKHGLDGKFVMMYAGNIGLTSCLEDILEAAEILRHQENIQFVIIGEGVKKEALQVATQARALPNILFLPYEPRDKFPEMLAAADVGLVTLNSGAMLSSLPSKIFNIMASARPILSISPQESELAYIVHDAGCGKNLPPGSPKELAEAVTSLQNEGSKLGTMGHKARAYFEKYYTREHCIGLYESMLTDVCKQTRVVQVIQRGLQ